MSKDALEGEIPTYIPVIAGGVSGCFTRLVCQPLDVIKIRFQLQVEPISRQCVQAKYRSIPQATALIVREEGVTALWKGHIPAQWLSLTYGVLQFGCYEALMNHARRFPHLAEEHVKVEFVSGFTAGCVATVLSFPFDIVRTRLVAQGNNKTYTGTIYGLKQMLQVEGFRSWWKGLTPNLLQIGPFSGFQFAVYNVLKRLFDGIAWLGDKQSVIEGEDRRDCVSLTQSLTLSGSLVAGSLSGVTAKVVTYPLDLTRKRLQMQGFQQARVGYGKNFTCTSFVNCLHEIVREERVWGLWKGLGPSLIKAGFVSALIFASYEKTHEYLCHILKV